MLRKMNENKNRGGVGENSEDECCLCGRLWDPSCTGWPLCDTPNCPNVCCCSCSQALIVSEMFFCPPCSGSGESAAATVGGAIATTVAVCSELEALPLSQKAIQAILRNLIKQPDNPKYRKLRLNNKKVKSLLDLDPCRRLLILVGFAQKAIDNEPVLVLEGSVNLQEVQQLLDILEGLSDDETNDTETNVKTIENPSKRSADEIDDGGGSRIEAHGKERQEEPGALDGPEESKKPKTE